MVYTYMKVQKNVEQYIQRPKHKNTDFIPLIVSINQSVPPRVSRCHFWTSKHYGVGIKRKPAFFSSLYIQLSSICFFSLPSVAIVAGAVIRIILIFHCNSQVNFNLIVNLTLFLCDRNIDIADNRWVVPFKSLLSKTFNTYINVEFRSSMKAIKYCIFASLS